MATEKLRGTIEEALGNVHYAERDVADLRRIPDDLSIPEFLKRGRRRILSDYERDDRESQKQIAGFRSAAEQLRKKGETK